MTAVGQEERYPPTRLSAGCECRKETLAGSHRNGQDAPIAIIAGGWADFLDRQLKLELAYRRNASVASAGPHWRKRSDLVHQTAR
jgi:hypothetical protein